MEEKIKKICNKCKEEKELSEFNKTKNSKDGYQYKCRLCFSEYNKQRYLENPDIVKERANIWKKENPNRRKEIAKNHAHKKYHEDVLLSRAKNRKRNKEEWGNKTNKQKKKHYKKNNDNRRKRCETNPLEALKHIIRTSIGSSIKRKGYTKKSKTFQILGCTYEEFKLHIESQWQEWMTWENRGLYNKDKFNYGWDIDHIIPISLAKSEEEVIKLNHYTNFQPLCSKINRDIKRDKII